MSNKADSPRNRLVTLRVNDAERAAIEDRRGALTVSEWFRKRLFGKSEGLT